MARERRWALPVAALTLVGVALVIASSIVISSVSGDSDADVLRAAHEHGSDVTLSSILQAGGFLLFAAPLLYLFRAAQARSSRVRAQLVGLVVAAPLFLSVAAILNAVATRDAASTFAAGDAKVTLSRAGAAADCRGERRDDGAASFRDTYGGGPGPAGVQAACVRSKLEDDAAANALSDAPARPAATGFGLGGRIGFAFALIYTCLYAMRTGLLTRFWGSLGMALGAASLLLLIQFTLIWFIYFGFLVAGFVPRGRPPAWEAGEAIPWPTPGEQAARTLEGDGGGDGEDREPAALPGGETEPGARRKRKQRS